MKRTDTTLLEQMQISDVEIMSRMELLGLTPASLDLLASHQRLIEDNIETIVYEFYEHQTSIDAIALLIGDADTWGFAPIPSKLTLRESALPLTNLHIP